MTERFAMRYCIRTVIILTYCFYSAFVISETLEEGAAAFETGDYLTAKRFLQPLAENGDAVAQRYLGEMYDKGKGVGQDYSEALYWLKKAAAQNDNKAQFLLGVKYVNGHGVDKNEQTGYAWIAVAFENGYVKAADALQVLNKTMPLEQRQAALQLAVEELSRLR
jgi:TPR repeat protein